MIPLTVSLYRVAINQRKNDFLEQRETLNERSLVHGSADALQPMTSSRGVANYGCGDDFASQCSAAAGRCQRTAGSAAAAADAAAPWLTGWRRWAGVHRHSGTDPSVH